MLPSFPNALSSFTALQAFTTLQASFTRVHHRIFFYHDAASFCHARAALFWLSVPRGSLLAPLLLVCLPVTKSQPRATVSARQELAG